MKRIFLILALSLFASTAIAADTPEDVFWTSVSKADLAEEYRLYVEQFPKGKYVAEAWRRIGRLEVTPPKSTPLIAGRYRDNGDGTVTDTTTKLQWMRCAVGQTWGSSTCQGTTSKHNWDDANKLSSNFSGHSDWRLPMIEELRSLVYCSSGSPKTWSEGIACMGNYQSPTVFLDVFPNSPSSFFWSGSDVSTYHKLGVYFNFGLVAGIDRSNPREVRLVRGGQ